MKTKSAAARRRAREGRLPADVRAPAADSRDDLAGHLDRAVQGLPERYRVPVVLCELQGLSYREAATRLGVKEGTLAGRLSRARGLLAARLRQAGVGVGAVPLVAAAPGALAGDVPLALLRSTVAAATGGPVPATVAALTHGVLTSMLLAKLLPATAAVALVAALALTTPADRGQAAPAKAAPGRPAAGADDPKRIDETLADPNLHHPRVWVELKLSAEQRDQIDRLLDAEEIRSTDLLKEMFHARGGDPQAMEARARALQRMAKLPTDTVVAIQTKVLKPEQAKRLRQIALQAKGPGAFLRADVKSALKLAADQERKLAEAVDAAWERIRIGGAETASEAYTSAMQGVLDGLTKEQQKAWDELTGPPFPMPDIVVRKMLNRHPWPGTPGPVPVPGAALPPGAAIPPPGPGGIVPVAPVKR